MIFLRVYRRVLRLLGPERWLAIVLAASNLALAGLHFAEPILFGKIIDVLASSDKRPPDETWTDSARLLAMWGAVGIGGIVASILVSLHADRLAHRRRLAAMARYFEHVLALPIAFHGDTHSGRLLKVMLAGADHLFGLWLAFFREHLETFVVLLLLLPFTLAMNWRLGALLIVLLLLFSVLTAIVVARTERAQAAVEEEHSALAQQASDALTNVVLVQSFTRLAAESRQLADIIGRLLAAQYPVLNWWAVVTVMTRASSTLTVIAIFVVGTWLHLDGRASVGEIVSFMGFATMLIGRLEQTMGFVSRLFFQMHALQDFFDVLDTPSSVADRPDARSIDRAVGDVAFEEVGFAYDGVRPAVRDLTFRVPAGSTVALVGHTGAGKSTALALLHRMRDPQEGRVTIDGVDIRDLTIESLRRNVGVVFQDSGLFHRSIADNLRVGRPDASDDELVAAARLAEAHEFIAAQPMGYRTLVGERGATLSGGERQRIAIARALLKDPPILILDEATSALDAVTEAKVQQALRALMKGRTTFVIAHRLSTIRDAQMILVFAGGTVVERG
ncbi:MAG: glucan ABC transporter ATP-binding protein/ permease, partial [Alphaproteobacteria bacterium]|nr:glucan ABC transporter ATP-binding protein/ permease [Alphaproteobacteria bacterium]